MFSWNKVSPRLGINVRLTGDSRTVLRATVGRYYRPVFLNDFTGVHPGITPVTLARFDPTATGNYTTIISVTDSKGGSCRSIPRIWMHRIPLRFLDRRRSADCAILGSQRHLRARPFDRDQIGWRDVGGVYGTQDR